MVDIKLKLISLAQLLTSFFSLNRPAVVFMGLPFAMVGVAYALISTYSNITLLQAALGITSVFLVTGGVHTMDDVFDRKRDRGMWPNRALSLGFATPKQATILAITCFSIGLSITLFIFNIITFFILTLATSLTILYSGYLRDKYGYLTLPLLIGLFPLGGYSAIAPSQLFNDMIPWVLFTMVSLWQAGHILAYSPPHGIELDGKTTIPTLFKRLSPSKTLLMAGILITILTIMSIYLYYLINLSQFYLILAIISGSFTSIMTYYVSIEKNCTLSNCMKATLTISTYGAGLFLLITFELLIRYSYDYFLILFILTTILLTLSIPAFIGTGTPYLENYDYLD